MNAIKVLHNEIDCSAGKRILDARPTRVWAIIQNNDAANVSDVFFGAEAYTAGVGGFHLNPSGMGATLTIPDTFIIIDANHPWAGEVFATASSVMTVVEFYSD